MPIDYVPILVLLIVAAAISVIAVVLPSLLGPKNPNPVKGQPYESGMIPITSPKKRFPVHYYVVAVIFIVFDVEVLFLYPWAVMAKKLKWFGIGEMAVFLFILLVGYVYLWRKGALKWD